MRDDTAKFFGRIEATGGDGYRAECWIGTAPDRPPEPGSGDVRTFATRKEAHDWIHGQAGARGFEHFILTGE